MGQTAAGRWLAGLHYLLLPIVLCLLLGRFVRQWMGMWWVGIGLWVAYALVSLLFRRQWAERFILDGTLVFTDEGIDVQGRFVPLADLRKVEAHFTFVRGGGAGRNGLGSDGNALLVYQRQPADPLRFNLLVESRAQRTAFDGLLRRWRKQGLDVVADVF